MGYKAFIIAALCVSVSGCDTDNKPVNAYALVADSAYSASLSSDGRYALVGSFTLGGHLWDTQQGERLFDWNHQDAAFSDIVESAFSPDASYAITATTTDLVLWQTQDGAPVWYWSSPGEILDMALAQNADYALLGLANHTAVYFDVKMGGIRHTLRHPARVRSVAISQDGRYALTGADDYVARFWDLETATLLSEQQHDNIVNRVALNTDGSLAFSAATLDTARVWETATGEIISSISGDEPIYSKRFSYQSAAFSNDSNQLLTGTSSGRVLLWDTRTGEALKAWKAQQRDRRGIIQTGVYAVAFNNNGGYLAIGTNGLLNELQ